MTPLNKTKYNFRKFPVPLEGSITTYTLKYATITIEQTVDNEFRFRITVKGERRCDLGFLSENKTTFLLDVAYQLFGGIGEEGTLSQFLTFKGFSVTEKFGMIVAKVFFSIFEEDCSHYPKGLDEEKEGFFFFRHGWEGASFIIAPYFADGKRFQILSTRQLVCYPKLEHALLISETDEIGVGSFLNLVSALDKRRS